MSTLVPVILSGGGGSRMWPLSREQHPKQLLTLLGNRTLLQNTALRVADMPGSQPPLVVCNESYRFLVAQQLHEAACPAPTIILEPQGRSTAPAIALAAFHLRHSEQDAVMLVMPSDHYIKDIKKFQTALSQAIAEAEKGFIATFGIVPTSADTGYGYIVSHLDPATETGKIEKFVEKPEKNIAEQLLISPDSFWNGGIFVFKSSVFLKELERYSPEIFSACRLAMDGASRDANFLRPAETAFLSSPALSVDYAIMEKTDKAVVVRLDCGWNDIGSWQRLWSVSEKDSSHNVLLGDVLCENTHHSYIHATSRFVATVGVKDIIVVETSDAVLIADQSHGQDVQKIFSRLKKDGRSESMLHKLVYRPWGSYECLEEGPGFKVKRLTVLPGAKISLQKHERRSEHWVVIKGKAQITRDHEEFELNVNESTFIPVGAVHRISNTTSENLEIIEVQTGPYLEEDDIIRFDDIYGRSVA